MLSEKQLQAKNLFFQTELTKTQISELLNVSRRSLHYWIRENNWDRLKKSAATLPAMLAENCYVLIARYTETLMSEVRIKRPVTPQEAETLHKLTLTAKKLKNHSTLNESMEMFAHFMERINKVSPQLADQIMPFVNDYIEERATINPALFQPEKLNEQGFIPYEAEDPTEDQKDIADMMAWEEERGNLTQVDIEAFRTMDEAPAPVHESAAFDEVSQAAPLSPDQDTVLRDMIVQPDGSISPSTTVDESVNPPTPALEEARKIYHAAGERIASYNAELEQQKQRILEEIRQSRPAA